MKDYYSILELSHGEDKKEIFNRLTALLRNEHPSVKQNSAKNVSPETFVTQLEALLLLNNEDVRRKYDLLLKHKNNTEVRHSIKYKAYKQTVEMYAKKYRSESEKLAKINFDTLQLLFDKNRELLIKNLLDF